MHSVFTHTRLPKKKCSTILCEFQLNGLKQNRSCLVPRRHSLVERDALWVVGLKVCGSQGVVGSMQTKIPAVLPNHHPSRPLFSRHTSFYRKAPGEEAVNYVYLTSFVVLRDCPALDFMSFIDSLLGAYLV